jgi:hypothetical protein
MMKRWFVWALFACAVFPLAAQADQPVSVYVPEVAGYGISPSDNFFFFFKLRNEVKAHNYSAVYSPRFADFQLISNLFPYVGDNGEETGACVLNVMLKNAAGTIIAEQELIFTDQDDINDQFTLLMLNIFSQKLTRKKGPPENWLDKWLYFGVGVYWTPRFYYGTKLSGYFANFGGEVSAEIHFHPLWSFETGLAFTSDWLVYSDRPDNSYQDMLMEIPILIKYVLKARDVSLAEPYAGLQINASLFRETKPFPLSISAGCLFGIQSEKGLFYFDPRLSIDPERSDFATRPSFPYHRTALHIGVGYKAGVFSREQPLKEHFWQLFTGTNKL